jgi:hypothetical protein
VSVRIAIVGDEYDALSSHRELNAVRGMLGEDVESECARAYAGQATAAAPSSSASS